MTRAIAQPSIDVAMQLIDNAACSIDGGGDNIRTFLTLELESNEIMTCMQQLISHKIHD